MMLFRDIRKESWVNLLLWHKPKKTVTQNFRSNRQNKKLSSINWLTKLNIH